MSSVICNDEEGAFIPATQRPNGSWRKPRRIKSGYMPPEEVPLYECPAKQVSSIKSQYPPGLHPDLIKKKEIEKAKLNTGPVITYSPTPGVILHQGGPETKSKKKKKKSSATNNNNNVESKGAENNSPEQCGNTAKAKSQKAQQPQQKKAVDVKTENGKTQKTSTDTSSVQPQQIDPSKRLKNLRKKLREIEAIEEKLEKGQKNTLDKDQLDKVARKPDVLSEILALQITIEGSD